MSFRQKVAHEAVTVMVTTLYFAVCFGILVLLKRLYLSEYQIEFRGLSLALLGALIVAKVVLVLEHVTLGQWIRKHAVAVEVVLRTILYTIGVAIALFLERGFEVRHEHGGFLGGVRWVIQHRDMHHVWADTIAVGASLLIFNAVTAARHHLGHGRLERLFLTPPSEESEASEHKMKI